MAGWGRFLDRDGETVLAGNALGLANLFAGSAPDRSAVCQGSSSASTIKLNALADSTNDAYTNYAYRAVEKNVRGVISAYVGATKIATLSSALTTAQQPTSTDTVIVFSSRKVFLQNIGTRPRTLVQARIRRVGDNDGSERLSIKDDTGTCVPPYAASVSVAAAVSTSTAFAAGTYYYRLASLASTGRTNGSLELVVTLAGTSEAASLAWTNHALSTGTQLFRSVVAGDYAGARFIISLGAGVATYADAGAAASSGTVLSTENTTRGPLPEYGYPPTLATAAIPIGTVQVGQMWPFWFRRDTPIALTESLNPRLADIEVIETT